MRVALVVMPFASASRPSLAAGWLKAELQGRGIQCGVHYLNLEFARRLGLERYEMMAEGIRTTVLAGDWVFSQAFYGDAFSCWNSYQTEVLADLDWGVQEDHQPMVREAQEEAPEFLSWAMSQECRLSPLVSGIRDPGALEHYFRFAQRRPL